MDDQQTSEKNFTKSSFILKFNSFVILLISLAMFGIGILGGYYLRGSNQFFTQKTNQILQISPTTYRLPTQTIKINPSPTVIYQIPKCDKEECLFNSSGNYLGFSILKGYYKKYDGAKWEWNNDKASCNGLVITGGGEKLINVFRKSAESGNTLNKIIDNNLVVNIDLSELSSTEKQLLDQSTITNPVELGVIRRFEAGRGAPTCYSLVDILYVKPSTE